MSASAMAGCQLAGEHVIEGDDQYSQRIDHSSLAPVAQWMPWIIRVYYVDSDHPVHPSPPCGLPGSAFPGPSLQAILDVEMLSKESILDATCFLFLAFTLAEFAPAIAP